MRFSIWPSTKRSWPEILDLVRHCEATGWDGVYFADHFMPHGDLTSDVDTSVPLDGDTLECWSVLAALAASVSRLRLGSLVSSVTFRHPAVLANIAAAVDNVSGGRLVLASAPAGSRTSMPRTASSSARRPSASTASKRRAA
jgi:alkanesulfonate monooxygenase SsuD/methylene tetrahydromethanopterin reductase-like flavin-dependent oxidoreductase (luciferase family)